MAKKKQSNNENLSQVVETIDRIQEFYEKNQKPVWYIGAAIMVLIFGYLAYTKIYMPKKENEAQAQLFKAQNYFAMDSFNLALDGMGNIPGFLTIIDEYGGTKAANLAKYGAGISYLQTGKYEEAIDMLSDFHSNDKMIQPMAYGATGDAHAQLGNNDKAISYYKKAAQANDNQLTAPMWWMRYAQASEHFGKLEDAKDAYELVTKKYPKSSYGAEAEKYLARIETKIANK